MNFTTKKTLSVQRQKRRLSKFASYFTVILIVLILLLGSYLIFVKQQVFNIKDVKVFGTKSFVNETDLLELARTRSYGKNILNFNASDLEHSLLEVFQGAKAINISKKYPSTLKLEVIEREPLAIIHDESRENFFLVDEEGYVLGQVGPGTSNFPEISYTGDIEVGYFLEKEVVSVYFELLNALDTEKISASSMSVHPKYISLYTNNDVEILVGKEKNIQLVAESLSNLLKQLATEGKDVKRVDLRYDKVIVSYR